MVNHGGTIRTDDGDQITLNINCNDTTFIIPCRNYIILNIKGHGNVFYFVAAPPIVRKNGHYKYFNGDNIRTDILNPLSITVFDKGSIPSICNVLFSNIPVNIYGQMDSSNWFIAPNGDSGGVINAMIASDQNVVNFSDWIKNKITADNDILYLGSIAKFTKRAIFRQFNVYDDTPRFYLLSSPSLLIFNPTYPNLLSVNYAPSGRYILECILSAPFQNESDAITLTSSLSYLTMDPNYLSYSHNYVSIYMYGIVTNNATAEWNGSNIGTTPTIAYYREDFLLASDNNNTKYSIPIPTITNIPDSGVIVDGNRIYVSRGILGVDSVNQYNGFYVFLSSTLYYLTPTEVPSFNVNDQKHLSLSSFKTLHSIISGTGTLSTSNGSSITGISGSQYINSNGNCQISMGDIIYTDTWDFIVSNTRQNLLTSNSIKYIYDLRILVDDSNNWCSSGYHEISPPDYTDYYDHLMFDSIVVVDNICYNTDNNTSGGLHIIDDRYIPNGKYVSPSYNNIDSIVVIKFVKFTPYSYTQFFTLSSIYYILNSIKQYKKEENNDIFYTNDSYLTNDKRNLNRIYLSVRASGNVTYAYSYSTILFEGEDIEIENIGVTTFKYKYITFDNVTATKIFDQNAMIKSMADYRKDRINKYGMQKVSDPIQNFAIKLFNGDYYQYNTQLNNNISSSYFDKNDRPFTPIIMSISGTKISVILRWGLKSSVFKSSISHSDNTRTDVPNNYNGSFIFNETNSDLIDIRNAILYTDDERPLSINFGIHSITNIEKQIPCVKILIRCE